MKSVFAVVVLMFGCSVAFAQEQAGVFSNDLGMSAQAFGIDWDNGPGPMPGPGGPGIGFPPPPPPCPMVKLTETQKSQMRAAFLQNEKDMVTLEANAKLAMLDFESLVGDVNADSAAADAASKKIADTFGAIAASKSALDSTVLFRILTVEQRAPAFECQKMMREMMRRPPPQACGPIPPFPPGSGPHGPGPGPGPGQPQPPHP